MLKNMGLSCLDQAGTETRLWPFRLGLSDGRTVGDAGREGK